ncbi:cysteine hydrolase family protein [Gracilimonas mengyeensis]|uniref:Nicotinamidase-related amidase n=1 Tax=Gracilimonas mengyeensis TaxID=1302730 RepID=A0A521DRI7_9BACT|nr:cysteine hydrolase family protein [Gracilimonas mengyeensis]SMO74316.1 Nicotinamidase-related amidase [Gracilimonas mengyeensis]
MKLRDKKPALILIDIQQGLSVNHEKYWGGNRNNQNAEVLCGKLLDKWRTLSLPLFHVRHSSTNPESKLHPSNKGIAFNKHVLPAENEPVITKHVNSGFIGTDLQEQLDQLHIKTLVLVGLTTNHCVSATTRMASDLGFETYVIADATATFDREGVNGETFDAELVHSVTLASLNEEFATVWDSHKLLAEL